MTRLDERIENLEKLTHELALDIKHKEQPILKYTQFLLNEVDTPAMITDPNDNIVYLNSAFKELLSRKGVDVTIEDEPWWKVFWKDEEPPSDDWLTHKCMKGREILHRQLTSRLYENREYLITCIPLIYNGVSGVLSFVRVIDE